MNDDTNSHIVLAPWNRPELIHLSPAEADGKSTFEANEYTASGPAS